MVMMFVRAYHAFSGWVFDPYLRQASLQYPYKPQRFTWHWFLRCWFSWHSFNYSPLAMYRFRKLRLRLLKLMEE